ncbi:MAG TPA: ABC transporter permease [Terrimesophilobacter sp.]|nr:ABC transporter permease [Terrimesophilobacter sp.]
MDLLLSSMLVLGTPLLFAALGGLIAERSGVINLGLEGLLLVGAFSAALSAAATHSVVIGVLVAIVVGGVGGALLGFLVIVLRADQIVIGIAFNIAALGTTGFLFGIIGPGAFRTSGEDNTRIPLLADIPFIGVLFDAHWIAFVGYALVGLVSVVLFRTGIGIRIRASGENAEAARASGVNVLRTRMVTMAVSGGVAALGGAYMALADAHQFGDNMIDGRGYIAFAIIILGRWKPVGVLAAAGLFAFAQGLDLFAQARSLPIPLELVQAVPYLIALATAALLGRKATPPAEEGRPLMLAN